MSFGVPFITVKNAITGGEIFNIKSDNGVVVDDIDSILYVLNDISLNPNKYFDMGSKAKEYYLHNCHPDNMILSVKDAIKYSLRT